MDASSLLPTLFLAHGAPTLALDGGAWGRRLADFRAELLPVKCVLVCSAHWETAEGFRVGGAAQPRTIHDFGGFPEALYTLRYPAPGAPDLAREVASSLAGAGIEVRVDEARGLDHGAWVPLLHLFPEAEVPVVQLSLPRSRDPHLLWEAGRTLAPLRAQGVLILGSGGLVHNLGRLDWAGLSAPEPWATGFEGWILDRLASASPGSAMAWREAPGAGPAVPTSEHLDPLWLAAGAGGGPPRTLFEGWQLGNLSLRCLAFDGSPAGNGELEGGAGLVEDEGAGQRL